MRIMNRVATVNYSFDLRTFVLAIEQINERAFCESKNVWHRRVRRYHKQQLRVAKHLLFLKDASTDSLLSGNPAKTKKIVNNTH